MSIDQSSDAGRKRQEDQGVTASPPLCRPSGEAADASSAKPAAANAFDRSVTFTPSFDKLREKPNCGIGAVRIRFVLKGPLGAVQWLIGTEWYVASARRHLANFPVFDMDGMRKPMGWDLGYHSPRPMYEDQSPMGDCDVLDGECYYDGSGLNADLLIEGFLAGGEDYVWRALEAYYRCTFEDAPWPFDKDGNLVASAAGARSAETGTGSGPQDRQSGDAKQRDAQSSQPPSGSPS